MKKSKTLTGVEFGYEGSVDNGLVIHKNIRIQISKNIIDAIRDEILRRSPILMGACRDNPSNNSIGEALRKQGYSPQTLSYVIPLLVEEGFCAVNTKKPFVISKK